MLDLLEGEQNSSVGEFDNAQNEHVFSYVIISFVHHIWLYLCIFVTKSWKSVYASKYSQVQEKMIKRWRNEVIMHIGRFTRGKRERNHTRIQGFDNVKISMFIYREKIRFYERK